LAAEQDKFIVFAQRFQLKTEELPFDLTGRIAAAMAATPQKRQNWATVYVTVAAVALLAVGISSGYMYFDNASVIVAKESAGSPKPLVAAAPSPKDRLATLITSLPNLVEQNDIADTVGAIEQVVAANPNMDNIGEALCTIADTEFRCLKRYDKAFAAYDKLRVDYPDLFDSLQDCATRYNLLAEARWENYGPLYNLDVARSRENSFAEFENIVADYPNTALAGEAVDEMCSLERSVQKGRPIQVADVLEQVRERCSNPIAKAQVDLTLGHHYRNTLHDRECAMACYQRVAASDHVALSNQAHLALAQME